MQKLNNDESCRRTTMLKKKREAMPRDADQTRKRILDAATVEFARKGLGGARVDEIAPAPRPTSA